MSTPGPGDDSYRPGAPNGGGPGSYGGPGEPTKYPYGQQSPYGQPSSPYAYSPYGSPYPKASEEPEEVTRPPVMIVALVLMMVSTLPFLIIGAALLALPADNPALQLVTAGVDSFDPNNQLPEDQRLLAVRVAGGVFLGLVGLYLLFAALAFTGRNWARILVTVMTAGFTVIWGLNLFAVGTMDAASLALVLGVLAAAIGGTVILYLRGPSRYFAGRAR